MDPKSFKTLFANSFQEEYLVSFVEALHDIYLMYIYFTYEVRNQEYKESMEVLKNLALIPRFNMIQMFLPKAIKQSKTFD